MMDCARVIDSVERFGAELLIDGPHIRIKKGKDLPTHITDNIRSKKREILAVLKSDKQAKEAGLMIGIPGELYTITLSEVSSIYVEHREDQWEAWRETHIPYQRKAIQYKIIASGNTLEFVLLKVRRYLDYISHYKIKQTYD